MDQSGSFTADEVRDLRKLLEIQRIQKTIQLYSHHMDARNFRAMADIYMEDAVAEWGPLGSVHGREEIYQSLVASHPDRLPYDGFHITTNAVIELTGEVTAISRNYLTDVWPGTSNGIITHPNHPDNPVILYAVYENDYRKINGQWLIARSVIQFMWPERLVSPEFPRSMEPISAI
jgi:SnoaL-like domain